MAFPRQHYIAVAKILKEAKEDFDSGTSAYHVLNRLDAQFANYFGAKSVLFDRDKFINACELGD